MRSPRFKIGRVKGKPNYYIKWTENGRSKYVSTGTENEAEARRQLSDFIEGWNAPPPAEQLTINWVLDTYLKHKEEQYSAKNALHLHRNMLYHCKPIRVFFGDLLPEQANNSKGRAYIEWRPSLSKKGTLSNETINKELSVLNAAINYCISERHIPQQTPLRLLPKSPPRDKWMMPEQVKLFLAAAQKPHIKLFCMLALHTLSRKSAILQLTWDRVDMQRRTIDFNIERQEKTKRRVVCSMNDSLYAAMDLAHKMAQTDHVIEYNDKPVKDVKRGIATVGEAVNMPWVSAHVFRHTGATLMAQRGVSMFDIAGLMGDNPQTVARTYAHHSPDHLKKATQALNDVYSF